MRLDPLAIWARRGPLAWLLRPLSALYGAALRWDRWRHRTGRLPVERLPVPVVVVGNLIAGGAGKTPTVIATVQALQARGWRPGVISRGYGRRATAADIASVTRDQPASEVGDEPLLVHLRTGVPVSVGRDRPAAGRQLLARAPEVDVLVSDDGLQHHRLARDVSVIVFDDRGVGNGWLLPAGPLREPMPSVPPAGAIVLYNAERASTSWPGHTVQRRLGGAVALADWWQGRPADAATLDALRGRPVVAACGLAHPRRYFHMLRAAGLQVAELPLPDHVAYDLLPWPADATDVAVTEKDAVKLDPQRVAGERPGLRVWVVALDFQPAAGYAEALAAALGPHRASG